MPRTSNSRQNDMDDDQRSLSSGRQRDDEGRFTSGRYDDDNRSGGNRQRTQGRDDEADYGAWHAYGHNRGWHSYQQRGNDRNRDDEGRFTSSGRGYADDDYDDRRSSRGSGGGRGWHGDSEGHAEAGRHSHDNTRGTQQSSGRYEDDDDNRSSQRSGRQRDEEGRFISNGQH